MALFSEYPSSLSIRSNASRGLLMLKSLSLNETSITSDLNSSLVFVPAAVVRRCKSSSSTGEAPKATPLPASATIAAAATPWG